MPSEVGVTGGVGAGDVDAEGPLLSRPPPPPVEVLTPPQKRRGRPGVFFVWCSVRTSEPAA